MDCPNCNNIMIDSGVCTTHQDIYTPGTKEPTSMVVEVTATYRCSNCKTVVQVPESFTYTKS